jgi:hypothetical protein
LNLDCCFTCHVISDSTDTDRLFAVAVTQHGYNTRSLISLKVGHRGSNQ